MGLPTGRRFDLQSRLQGSTPCRSTDISTIGRAARWSEQRPYKTKRPTSSSVPEVRFLPRRLGKTKQNGIVADKVMHRSLKPADVGSIPADPTTRSLNWEVRSLKFSRFTFRTSNFTDLWQFGWANKRRPWCSGNPSPCQGGIASSILAGRSFDFRFVIFDWRF